MMSWEMVREQAKIWGVGLYFPHRKVKFPKLTEFEEETFADLPPDELQAIGVARTMLSQATLKSTYEEDLKPKKCKAHSYKDGKYVKIQAIYRNREELDNLIRPRVALYEEKNLSPQEAGILNQDEAERRAKAADETISHPAQGNIAEIRRFTQLRPEDVNKYIDYSKSTAALHDFFAGQTGLKMRDMIP